MNLKEKVKSWFCKSEIEVTPEEPKLKDLLEKAFEPTVVVKEQPEYDYQEALTPEAIYAQIDVTDNAVGSLKEIIDTMLNGKLEGLNDSEIIMLYKLVKLQKLDLNDLQYDIIEKMDALDTSLNECIQVINQRIAENEEKIITHKKLIDNDKRTLSKQAIAIKHEQSELERLTNVINMLKQFEKINF